MGKKMLRGECVCVYSNDSPSRTYTTSHDSLDDDEPANDGFCLNPKPCLVGALSAHTCRVLRKLAEICTR